MLLQTIIPSIILHAATTPITTQPPHLPLLPHPPSFHYLSYWILNACSSMRMMDVQSVGSSSLDIVCVIAPMVSLQAKGTKHWYSQTCSLPKRAKVHPQLHQASNLPNLSPQLHHPRMMNPTQLLPSYLLLAMKVLTLMRMLICQSLM